MNWKKKAKKDIETLYYTSGGEAIFYAGNEHRSIWFCGGYDWCLDEAFGRAEAKDYVIVAHMMKIDKLKKSKSKTGGKKNGKT